MMILGFETERNFKSGAQLRNEQFCIFTVDAGKQVTILELLRLGDHPRVLVTLALQSRHVLQGPVLRSRLQGPAGLLLSNQKDMMSSGGSGPDRIQQGHYVIVQRGDHHRILIFKSDQLIVFGSGKNRQSIRLKNAENEEFYSAFRVVPSEELLDPESTDNTNTLQNNKKPGVKEKFYDLEKLNEPASKSFSLQFDALNSISSGKDNRNIVDDKTSQSLDQTQIHNLKDQGLSSQEILSNLVTGSKSFSQKTEFAQEKYLRKKEKVHGDVLIFLKPDLVTIAEYYFKRDSVRILDLRIDTISQILSYGNVHAGGRYILYENASGIIVGAVLSRMGGIGQVLHCHAGTNPPKQALNYLNLTEEQLQPLRNLDVFYLIPGRLGNKEEVPEDQEATADEESAPKRPKLEEGDDNSTPKSAFTRIENEKSLELLKEPFHSLIICAKEHPLSIFKKLLFHLSPSSPFVIYSSYAEPLIECYMWVKEKGLGVNVHVVDNWFRTIQVEPERTHPEINMSSSGGYILYGTYVVKT